MAMQFSQAIGTIYEAAERLKDQQCGEHVSIYDAAGRIAFRDCISARATPSQDTSAMDGFALDSSATAMASSLRPVRFQIVATVVPGQQVPAFAKVPGGEVEPCLEVCTGAPFPADKRFDACVKVEDTHSSGIASQILVSNPVQPNAHRRRAGCDLVAGEVLLSRGEQIRSSHILPLASTGFEAVEVAPKVRTGIWSTGSEYVTKQPESVDVNGPYLTNACREYGCDTTFLGAIGDTIRELKDEFKRKAGSGDYDVLITSGAVSMGKFDCVRDALNACDAEVVFHGLDIRPGHPVLFAFIPGKNGPVAFFGLPGNPGAAAACLRFLVLPYIRRFQGRPIEQPISATAKRKASLVNGSSPIISARDIHRFIPGILRSTSASKNEIELDGCTTSAKLRPFIEANFWAHVPQGCCISEGQSIDCYPMSLKNE